MQYQGAFCSGGVSPTATRSLSKLGPPPRDLAVAPVVHAPWPFNCPTQGPTERGVGSPTEDGGRPTYADANIRSERELQTSSIDGNARIWPRYELDSCATSMHLWKGLTSAEHPTPEKLTAVPTCSESEAARNIISFSYTSTASVYNTGRLIHAVPG